MAVLNGYPLVAVPVVVATSKILVNTGKIKTDKISDDSPFVASQRDQVPIISVLTACISPCPYDIHFFHSIAKIILLVFIGVILEKLTIS